MLADGYAAATTRRVAKEAGVNSALVSYYFGSLDGMFVALFRRGAERSYERLQQALASPQPLWAFWDLIHEQSGSASTMEFIALANHRKVIRQEIARFSRRFRRTQLEALTDVLEGYGLDPDEWPASVVVLGLSGLSRYLLMEQAFGVDIGHRETEAKVEQLIERLEGPRPRLPARRRR
jgi:AcrR family transcriptional regulator